MSDLRNVSSNPHIRAKDTTSRIMLTVVIALLLPAFFGIYNFGFRALVLILISIATCVLTEYIYEKLMKKPITIGDFSAVVTGLLLALNLPVSVPFWIPATRVIANRMPASFSMLFMTALLLFRMLSASYNAQSAEPEGCPE